jgi:branched-subunit amino acid aminotransferase/4-amino-4-deoxychorismate lyase
VETNKASYNCFNGDYIKAEDPALRMDNRSFCLGDALVEHIHAYGTEAQFLDLHLNRLKQSMQKIKMTIPAFFTTENFSRLMTTLLNKNRLFGGTCLRLTVFRNTVADRVWHAYVAGNNTVSFTIESLPLENGQYVLNSHGYVIDLNQEIHKPAHPLSAIKSTSALLYVLSEIYAAEKGLDDCILINDKGHLVESARSNIFIVCNREVFTPGLDQGCIPGVMREVVIKLLQGNHIRVHEDHLLTEESLQTADEVFLTNAIEGLRWVLAFRKKRFYRDISDRIIRKVNELAFGEQ